MSAPVDVLAVMDATADYLSLTPDCSSKPLREARAAVAELIAAAKDVLEISGGTPEHARMYAALARLGALP